MKKLKVFISSVQGEFAAERKALVVYLREDSLLGSFFKPFIFEEVAANTHEPGKVYLEEVESSDVYIGIMGENYGYEDAEGVSPTEREYQKAKNKNIPRWVYIKKSNKRHPKETALIKKVEQDVSRKMFSGLQTLKEAVYHSCVLYLKQTGKITSDDFDNSINEDANSSAIDEKLVKEFVRVAPEKRRFPLKETANIDEVLLHLRLKRGERLVNSTLLVFNRRPQQFFPTATIKCAHFHDIYIQKPIPDYKEFGGTVFQMADEAVDFILSKISLSSGTRDRSNIVDTAYEIPRAVIAEAVINAVAHRDYYSKGSIQVSVFTDRVEVSNPGDLPPELSIEDLKVPHSSYPHNPLLAECMFLYGAIERYGTGMLDVLKKTREHGLKMPEISLKEGFKVILWRPSAITDQATDQAADQAKKVRFKAIGNLVHRLVLVIDGEMGRHELMDKLELKHIPNFRENYLKPAQEEGFIEMVIPDKPTIESQRYRLTSKGFELQKQLKKEYK